MISVFVQRTEEEANKALAKNPTSLDAPREIYKKALESKIIATKRCSSVRERTGYEEEIRELYISRAAMEIQMGQKKQANLVFEEAMKLDFCRRDPVFWKAYINFFIRIGKYERARKLFKKSLEYVDVSLGRGRWRLAQPGAANLGLLGKVRTKHGEKHPDGGGAETRGETHKPFRKWEFFRVKHFPNINSQWYCRYTCNEWYCVFLYIHH